MNGKAWLRAVALGWALLAMPLASAHAGGKMGKTPDAAQQARLDELQRVGLVRFTGHDYKPGLIRHIVLFRYRPGTTASVRAQIRAQFLAMQQTAVRQGRPYILSIETGVQSSGEGADQGLEDGFLVTFRSEGDRNYFVGSPIITTAAYFDPVHARFKDFALPHVQSAVVFDYARSDARPNISVP